MRTKEEIQLLELRQSLRDQLLRLKESGCVKLFVFRNLTNAQKAVTLKLIECRKAKLFEEVL